MSSGAGWINIWPRRTALAVVVFFALSQMTAISRTSAQSPQATIIAAKILNFRLSETGKRFGALEFVGGLQLQSETRGFGGFSGLRLHPDRNHLIAVTDKCMVLDAVIERDITGALHDITKALLRPLPAGRSGKPLAKNGYSDCEALDVAGGTAYIAFERNSETGRFSIAPDGTLTDFAQMSPKPGIGRLDRNRGIEAMALFPQGSVFAGGFLSIAEETLDASGNHRAFATMPDKIFEFAVARRDDYAITDADFLPNGDLVLLERRFGLQVAPGMRIRKIAAGEIAASKTVDGDVLLEAGIANRIDNMEGIDVSVNEIGETFLTLISDDNFNYFQSTLLLEFKLLQ